MNRAISCFICLLGCLGLHVQGQTSKYLYDPSGNLSQRAPGSTGTPQIIQQPQNQVVVPGELASFSVLVADTAGSSYQWRFYGTNLAGQIGDALLVRPVTAGNQGPYSVVVVNNSGSITSSVAQLYIDSNANGIPDTWETLYFGNLNQNALSDFDGDGISNLQEFLDGTNPTNKTSFRSRLTIQANGGVVTVTPAQASYATTDSVTLTATAFAPNSFFAWTGDLTARTNPATLSMETNKTVVARFACAAAPQGMVGWWRGENNALDALGLHSGSLSNGLSFSEGQVGHAFNFTATNQEVKIPASSGLNVGPGAGLTIEAWIKPGDLLKQYPLVDWNDGTNAGAHFWMNVAFNGLGGSGNIYANLRDTSLGDHYFFSPNNVLSTSVWQHIALTYERTSGTARLYLNGLVVSAANLGSFIPLTSADLHLGYRPGYFSYSGLLDEPTVYNRALTSAEVFGIYAADAAGKCSNVPYILSPSQFPNAVAGTPYSQQSTSVLGTPAVTFMLSAGSLPTGLTLSASGAVSGTPTVPGTNTFALRAVDSAGLSSEQVCSLVVGAAPVVTSPPGLLAWWRAEGNALDYLGAHNGALSNGVTYASGKVGQAFSFDGANSFVVAPDSGLPSGNAARTIEFWMQYATGASGNHEPFFYGSQGVGSSFYIVIIGNRLHIGQWGGGDTPGSTIATDGNWHHVALTHDGFITRMYVDGQLDASSPRVYSTTLSGSFYMGALLGTSDRFKGLVDELSVYNRALSDSEIASLYKAGGLGKNPTGPYFNTPPRLPDAVIGVNYAQSLSALFATAPLTYSITKGNLPGGLNLNAQGQLSGMPTTAGSYSFNIQAADSLGARTESSFELKVYAPVPPPPGLISWWRGETNVLDSAGTNNGVLRNGVTFATGEVNQAFALDGGSQSVEIADAPSLRPASVTIETWALFTATGTRAILGKPVGPGFSDSYQIFLSNGNLGGFVGDSASPGPQLLYPFSPVFGTWYHLAYTFDDTSKQQALYLNGAAVATSAANKTIGYDTQPMLLGRDTENGSPNFFFGGRLDESAVYNRALGSNEITSLFNAGPAGKSLAGPAFGTSPVLPLAIVGVPYNQAISLVRDSTAALSISGGGLPSGLALSSSGQLGGTPTESGAFNFVVRATDAATLTADQPFTLQVAPRVVPPAGIAGWWQAENNTFDSIGTNDGYLVNSATFAPGKVGQAFSFSGFSDAVEIEDAPELRPNSVTLEAWVLFWSPSGVQSIMGKTVGGGIGDSYMLWLENGFLKGAISDITGAYAPVGVPFSPMIGQWYHLAFTFDTNTKQQILYINGAPVAFSISNLSIGYDRHPLLIGADVDNGGMGLFLQGRIDEAALYNRALTGTEIASIYAADAAGKTADGPYIDTAPSLPDAAYGVSYSQKISSSRGTGNISYVLVGGSVPPGMNLTPQGLFSGIPTSASGLTPTNATAYNFIIRATDAAGVTADQSFSLLVAAPVSSVPGLISWWRAENNALDSIGTNHGLALNGTTYTSGKVGEAFLLDGINDCILVQDSSTVRPASLTLQCWVMFQANTGIRVIMAKPLGGGILDSYALWLENGNLRGEISDNFASGPAVTIPFSPVLGQWYHVAYTYDNATRQQVLYLNNVNVASGLSDRSIAYDANPLLLGCDMDNGNRNWFVQGSIDEAALYNRALSSAEVAAIYAAGAAGQQSGSEVPLSLQAAAQGTLLTLSLRGTPGMPYTIESKSTLDSNSWGKVASLTASNGLTSVTVAISASRQFYRARTGN